MITLNNRLDVCYTPAMLHIHDIEERIVVVIDILRATSTMCVGFSFGVEKMIPVMTIDECEEYKQKGILCAAERNGEKVHGFELGNSPFGFMNENLRGKIIAITTTNGTIAIHAARKAYQIAIGAFTNITALCEYLKEQDRDILLLCAGWKNRFNLEDTLFAGAMTQQLRPYFEIESDTALAAEVLYEEAKDRPFQFLKNSSHARRLAHLNIKRDIRFCLIPDLTNIVPLVKDDYIYNPTHQHVLMNGKEIRERMLTVV